MPISAFCQFAKFQGQMVKVNSQQRELYIARAVERELHYGEIQLHPFLFLQ